MDLISVGPAIIKMKKNCAAWGYEKATHVQHLLLSILSSKMSSIAPLIVDCSNKSWIYKKRLIKLKQNKKRAFHRLCIQTKYTF